MNEDERCPLGCECPKCGEWRIDYLAIDEEDEDFVDCETCGQRYRLEFLGVDLGFRAIPVEKES